MLNPYTLYLALVGEGTVWPRLCMKPVLYVRCLLLLTGEVNGYGECASIRRGEWCGGSSEQPFEETWGIGGASSREQQIMTRSVTVIVSYWEGFHMGGERERERKGSYPIFTWETLSAGGPRV